MTSPTDTESVLLTTLRAKAAQVEDGHRAFEVALPIVADVSRPRRGRLVAIGSALGAAAVIALVVVLVVGFAFVLAARPRAHD